jgi:hypothetical protein
VEEERPSIKGPRSTTNRQVPWKRWKHRKNSTEILKRKASPDSTQKKEKKKKVSVKRKECFDRVGRRFRAPRGAAGKIGKKKSEAVSHGKRMNRVAQFW